MCAKRVGRRRVLSGLSTGTVFVLSPTRLANDRGPGYGSDGYGDSQYGD